MKIFHSILSILNANVIYAIFALLVNIIIARWLGPSLKGEYTIFILISSLSALVLRSGMDISLIRFVKKEKEIETLLLASIFCVSCISIIYFLIFYFFTNQYLFFDYFIFSREYFNLIYIIIFLELISVILSSYLLGIEKVKNYSIALVIQPFAFSTLICSYLFFYQYIDIKIIVISGIFSFLIKLIYIIINLDSKIFSYSLLKISKSFELLRFGFRAHIGNVIDFFLIRVDIILLAYFTDLVSVGIYSVAALAEKINIFSTSVGSAVLSKIKSHEDIPLINQILRLCILVISLIAMIMIALSSFIITLLFGEEFSHASYPFIILLIGFSILFVSKPMKSFLIIDDKPNLLMNSSYISLAVNIILNLLLIPLYGIYGAAIATTISNIIYTLYIIFFYKKYSKSPLMEIFIIKTSDIRYLIRVVTGK